MKLNKYIFVLILYSLLFTLSGCRPKGILSSREMRQVLVDLHKTDGMLQTRGARGLEYEDRDLYYAQVLAKHHVTQAQFDSSLVWYTAHPQFFNKIYPKVLKDLEAEEEAFNELYAEELAGMSRQKSGVSPQHSTFSRTDLDSVLWVMQNGYGNSWKRWERPLPTPPYRSEK